MIRIFVGCSANGEDAEAAAMLEYSLRKYASDRLEINWMKLSRDPSSPWYSNPAKREGWNTVGWATPFSAFRWAIPHVCGYQGKGIYMDVDMVALDDIAKLNSQPIPPGKAILGKSNGNSFHHCVMVFDCAAIKPMLPSFDQLRTREGMYRNVRNNVTSVMAPFKNNWNCHDGEKYATLTDPDIKVLHFTKVETQPHLKWALPRLKNSGRMHWNAHTLKSQTSALPHARADVQPYVDKLWEEAQAAGYKVEDYEPAEHERFGNYNAVRGGQRAA